MDLLAIGVALASAGAPAPSGVEFFETRIRPALHEHCVRCHTSERKRPKGGLVLDEPGAWLRGGTSGPAVVPEAPGESLLIRAVRYEDPDLEMPPDGKLPPEVIADLERWVARGAPAPEAPGPAPAEGEERERGTARDLPWSFRPVRRPPVPEVRDASWPRGAIDRFVLARLEAEGLRPAPDADRATFYRRLHFALTGLPPPPAATEAFVADDRRDARARAVDRLLASPRFAERFGRHWLDVARYAESTGGGRSRIYRTAWRYRDRVVEAFAEDLPFDAFIEEQIAGDLLPAGDLGTRRDALVATGFLALGPKNLDDQDKERLRMDVVDEQLDTIGRAFLGLTLGCARCHDHKFDPIPTRDYYALAGILRSTKTLLPGNVSGVVQRELPVTEARRAALRAHAGRVERLEARAEAARKAAESARSKLRALRLERGLDGVVVDNAAASTRGDWTSSTSVEGFFGEDYIHDGNAGKGAKSVTWTPDLPHAGRWEVRLSWTRGTNRAPAVPVVIRHASPAGDGDAESRRVVDQRERPALDGTFERLGVFPFAAGQAGSVTVSNEGTDAHVIADAVQFVAVDPPPAASGREDAGTRLADVFAASGLVARSAEAEARRAAVEAELEALRERAPPPPPKALSVREEEAVEDARVHRGGSTDRLGDPVPRGFLTSCPVPGAPRPGPDSSGRLELARWIAHPENPLTARVIVNRVWGWMLGRGIVPTPDNFGAMGRPPSHPALLDFLASDFVARGWSVRRLVRRIALSRVFSLASRAPRELVAADPENRLFGRFRIRRLEAECIRDAMLTASGELDLAVGGPTIRDGTGSEFGYTFDEGAPPFRRSLWLPVFRNALPDVFEAFDFPNPNLVTGLRPTSTVPTQALWLLNAPFVLERARAAAERLLRREDLDTRGRIELAWRRVLGRPPRPGERAAALRRLEAVPSGGPPEARLEAWSGIVQGLFASIDFRHLR